MAGTLTVQNLQGPTTGANANKIIVPSGHVLNAAGHVLQVLNTSYSTYTSMTQGSWVDIGLSLSITPKSASSDILIFYYPHYRLNSNANDAGVGFRLLRDSTPVDSPNTNYQQYTYAGNNTGSVSEIRGLAPLMHLDSPATTSSITYKVQGNAYFGSVYTQDSGNSSKMTVMEIAG
jgi:hypothetical protein